jgi:hypothetical protein
MEDDSDASPRRSAWSVESDSLSTEGRSFPKLAGGGATRFALKGFRCFARHDDLIAHHTADQEEIAECPTLSPSLGDR